MRKKVIVTDDGFTMKKDQPWYFVSKLDFTKFGCDVPDWKDIEVLHNSKNYFYFKEKSFFKGYIQKCAKGLIETLDEI